jgi:signal transduction histidine kinase
MKLLPDRALLYLAVVYLMVGALYFLSIVRHINDPVLLIVARLGFILFVLVTYEPFQNRVSQLIGHQRPSAEVGYFSAFVEFNRRIQNVLDLDDVLVLLSDALRQHVKVKQVRYLLNAELPVRGEQNAPEDEEEQALSLRSWPLQRIWNFHTVEFEREIKARASVMSFKDAPPVVQRAFAESGTNLLVPLVQDQRLLGVLLIGRADNRVPYAEFEYQMFDYLMRQLALIVDRIRVYAEVLRKTKMEHAEKMHVMQSLSASIAHEMRTPLAGIRARISGFEEYLPQLLAAYEHGMKCAPQQFPLIRDSRLQRLEETPRRVMLMIDQANTVIDLLLVNLREHALDRGQLDPLHAAAVVLDVVERYPFRSGEREKVRLDLEQDFVFLGVETFFVYVLFNLLKNAFYSLQSAQKGGITIRLERGDAFNSLYFRDTGTGVDPAIIGRIFDGFFTTKRDGTGAGLAFCKRTILSFGGEIACESVSGEYAEFVIRLPHAGPRGSTPRL